MYKLFVISFLSAGLITACSNKEKPNKETIDDIAVAYVKLCLDIGKYDNVFVDAYYGPKNGRQLVKPMRFFLIRN